MKRENTPSTDGTCSDVTDFSLAPDHVDTNVFPAQPPLQQQVQTLNQPGPPFDAAGSSYPAIPSLGPGPQWQTQLQQQVQNFQHHPHPPLDAAGNGNLAFVSSGSSPQWQQGQSPPSVVAPAIPLRPAAVPIPRDAPTGPINGTIELRPRAKPGRKRIEGPEASHDRRKAQNRGAQQTFRRRRAEKLEEAQDEIARLRAQIKEEDMAHRRQLDEARVKIHSQRARIDELEAEKARRDSVKSSQNSPTAVAAGRRQVLTSNHQEVETDFTTQNRRRSEGLGGFRADSSTIVRGCGYCKPGRCMEADADADAARTLTQLSSHGTPPTSSGSGSKRDSWASSEDYAITSGDAAT